MGMSLDACGRMHTALKSILLFQKSRSIKPRFLLLENDVNQADNIIQSQKTLAAKRNSWSPME
jgi:hypothetical protein